MRRTNFKDITEKKFGILKAQFPTEKRTGGGNIIWHCLCECGNEIDIQSSNLIRNRTKSCGCLDDGLRDAYGRFRKTEYSSINNLYYRYKQAAIRRSLQFDLTKNEFLQLTKGLCYFCEKTPEKNHKANPYSVPYIYNGIDRVDNSIGYVIDNCVACCRDCNSKKGGVTVEMARKIINFIDGKTSI